MCVVWSRCSECKVCPASNAQMRVFWRFDSLISALSVRAFEEKIRSHESSLGGEGLCIRRLCCCFGVDNHVAYSVAR